MEKTWTVVQFKDEDTVEAVPSGWLSNNSCYWPPFSREKLLQCIKKNEEHSSCWPLYPIRSFRNSTYSEYLVAREKAKIAESTSDLYNSDTEKRKITRKYFSSSDSADESQIPSPPRFKKTQSIKRRSPEKINERTEEIIQYSDLGPLKAPKPNKQAPKATCSQVINLEKDTECICCKIHPYNDQLLKDLVRKQNILYVFFKQMNDDIQEIKIKLSSLNLHDLPSLKPNKTSIFELFNFPLKSYDELIQLETFLEDNENNVTMVREISQLGGNSLYEFLKRSLSTILCNSLAVQFTWFGLKEKKPFKNLKFAQVLIGAAEIFDAKTNKKDIEDCIRKWLRRARERKDAL